MINGHAMILVVSMVQTIAALIYAYDGEYANAVFWTGIVIANVGFLLR